MKYLEWIEGTGDQYIDTLFTPNQDSCIELEFSYTSAISSNNALFGVRKATSENNFSIFHPYGYPLSFYSCNAYYNSTLNPPVVGTKYKVKMDKNKVYIDDVLVHTFTLSSFTCPYTALLWGMKNNADSRGFSGKFRMYSCKIWDNGSLVRDYAPAKDNNDVVCLYDKVSQSFFYNIGSGTFSAGREIIDTGLGWSAYADYLVSDVNELIATIAGRAFTKTNAGYAVAVSVYPSTTGFSGPILLSTVQSSAYYTAYGMDCGSSLACHYAGHDWYMTAFGIWMSGNTIHNTNGKAPEWSMAGYTADQTEAIALAILQAAGVKEIPSVSQTYLLKSGANYYTISGGVLTDIGSTLNAALFSTYGMNNIPDWSDYSSLTNPTLLCWNPDELVDMVATTTGLPSAQSITTAGIAISPQGADGIDVVEITDTGSPKYAFSVDDGTTWKVLSGGSWVTSSGVASDMTSADVEALTSTEWDSLTSGATFVKIRFTLLASTDAVTEIVVHYAQA